MRLSLLTCALALLLAAPAGAAWTHVGGVYNANPGTAGSPTSLTGVAGVPHVAWTEGTPDAQVRVARWDFAAGAWTHLGTGANPVFPASAGSSEGALADVNGQPWIALADHASGFGPTAARVARWNGQAWEPVGQQLNAGSASSATRPVLAMGQVPVVAWIENGGLFARRFENGAWSAPSADLRLGTGNVLDTSIATVAGTPHLAWIEGGTDGAYRVFARRFDGTAWVDVTGSATPVNPATTPAVSDVAIAGSGSQAWVLYSQGAAGVRAARLDGTSWTQVGGTLNAAGATADSVALSPHGSTLLAALNETTGATAQARVKRLDRSAGAWVEVVGGPNPVNTGPTTFARSVRIASVAGSPYVAWGEAASAGDPNTLARAARLDPDWGALETVAVTATTATVRSTAKLFGVEFPLMARFGAGGALDRITQPVVFSQDTQELLLGGLAPATGYGWRLEVADGIRTSAVAPRTGAFATAAAPAAPQPPVPPAVVRPELRVAGVGEVVSGTIRVRLPGSRTFVTLGREAVRLPVRTEVDARKGRIRLSFERPGRRVQAAIFFAGRFEIVSQSAGGLVRLSLRGRVTRCRPTARSAALAAASARRKRKKPQRRLWGDGAGRFRTSGRYAAAVVRGTKWLTEDYCDRTRVTVRRGRVDARDLVRRRTVRLRAGRSYTARPRRSR